MRLRREVWCTTDAAGEAGDGDDAGKDGNARLIVFFLLSGSGHEWLNAFDIISICSCAMYPVLLWEQIDSCGSKDVRARSLV